MTSGLIFNVASDGSLARMIPGAPPNEAHLQALIARHPELISDEEGPLLLIRREQPISDSHDGGGRWSLDHLFVSRTAVPVLVELKRAVDTRLRREVVGQLLDYAANGVAYWQSGQIAEAFSATCRSEGMVAENVLGDFLGDRDSEEFWTQVDANFKAGRIKLVFVADVIPPELARIVEFLNEQMQATVRAVELKWFEGANATTTLVPRVIGETQRASANKALRTAPEPVSIEDWIERDIRRYGATAVAGASAYCDWIRSLGGDPYVAKLQGSIVGSFVGRDGKTVYPLHLWEQGGIISLSFRYLLKRSGLVSEEARRKHYDAFAAVVGPLSTSSLSGSPGFKVSLLADPSVVAALRDAGEAFVAAAVQA